MKAPTLETADPSIRLIEPDIERDARLGVAWLDGQVGRKTLELMGVPDKDNKPSSLDKERERVRGFIVNEDQLNWMIEADNKVVGSIWVDLHPTDEIPGPSIHIMIGDPEARGHGIGDTVTKSVINYLHEQGNSKIYSRRLTSNDNAAKLLSQNGFVEQDIPYTDKDELTWQNVVLDLQH